MKIVIAGGTGFLGNELVNHFKSDGYEVFVLTRGKSKVIGKVNYVHWDAFLDGEWENCLLNTDVVINLTGKSVNCRYTESNKQEIISSRVNATKALQKALNKLEKKPSLWINASAASIYGQHPDVLMTEESITRGNDFSAVVAQKWEEIFFQEYSKETRKVALRISLILGKSGGVFPVFKKLTRLFLGGKMGDGNQKFGWVHIEDVIRMIDFIIQNDELSGPVNCVSPKTPTNQEFMKGMRKSLNVAFGIPQPKFLLDIGGFFIGTESELILSSIYAYPKQLIDSGFKFKFENHQDALNDLSK